MMVDSNLTNGMIPVFALVVEIPLLFHCLLIPLFRWKPTRLVLDGFWEI